jgi:hypothetical protein
VFDLFDDLLLMSQDGRLLYHGPISRAVAFFDALGFRCFSLRRPGSLHSRRTRAALARH